MLWPIPYSSTSSDPQLEHCDAGECAMRAPPSAHNHSPAVFSKCRQLFDRGADRAERTATLYCEALRAVLGRGFAVVVIALAAQTGHERPLLRSQNAGHPYVNDAAEAGVCHRPIRRNQADSARKAAEAASYSENDQRARRQERRIRLWLGAQTVVELLTWRRATLGSKGFL